MPVDQCGLPNSTYVSSFRSVIGLAAVSIMVSSGYVLAQTAPPDLAPPSAVSPANLPNNGSASTGENETSTTSDDAGSSPAATPSPIQPAIVTPSPAGRSAPATNPAPIATPKPEAPAAATISGPTKPDVDEPSDNSKTKTTAAPAPPARPRLIVTSWAGAYGDAQARAIIAPLSKDLKIEIDRRAHDGKAPDIASADVAELDQGSLWAACGAGHVLKLPKDLVASLTRDGDADFIANSRTDCGVPTFAWSSLIIANGATMKKLARRRYRTPNRLADILDVKRFPGKRALIREPGRILEMMLMADGVLRDDVYAELSTRRGQDRAFNLLDRLSSHILWVESPREALMAFDAGTATMSMIYSGRAFRRLIASQLLPIWDGHIIDYASWAVPATSKNRDRAKRFILAATTAQRLAAQARIWPYGPMRRSALQLARRHDLLNTPLEDFMPTSDKRLAQGLIYDASFWAKNGKALTQRFEDWQAGIPLGIRVPRPTKAPPPPLPPLPRRGAAD